MNELKKIVEENYGNRVRIRVCGILIKDEKILMIKHRGIGENNILWLPPGGGIEFGENMQEALKREVLEETGLECSVLDLLFVNEYLNSPFHAIELFFRININDQQIKKGTDPEYELQIIEEVRYMNEEELYRINPVELHNVFRICKNFKELLKLKGYVLFPK